MKNSKLKQALSIASDLEKDGQGFFNRAGQNMVLWVRANKQCDPTQWPQANDLVDKFLKSGIQAYGPEVDQISGHLVVSILNVYGKAA